MTEYNKKNIQEQFDVLKLHDPTVKNIWDAYQYGDIRSYQEALRYMVVMLVEQKQDLSRRLLKEYHIQELVRRDMEACNIGTDWLKKFTVTNAVSDKRI